MVIPRAMNQQLTNENKTKQNKNKNMQGSCSMCTARIKIQDKYLAQVCELYQDFHITKLPLQTYEVRGARQIRDFSRFLLEPATL